MDNFKITYYRYDDFDAVIEKIKGIMKSYDMYMVKSGEEKYIFESDTSYTRSFIVRPSGNEWIMVYDDDEGQAEEFVSELSQALLCPALCIGVYKSLLYYTYFVEGEQDDQYLSTMDYYEYEINDEAVEKFKGDPQAFKDVLKPEKIEDFQNVLNNCKNLSMDISDGYNEIRVLLGIIMEEKPAPEENNEDDLQDNEDQDFEPADLMYSEEINYVDFHSINIMIDDQKKAEEAVVKIAEGLGYKKVEDFNNSSNEKKGFFKKLLNSIKENKRLRFYISPPSQGWVTLVGEQETVYGDGTSEWEFVDIDEQLSEILEATVVNVYSNSEAWGFQLIRKGRMIFEFNSDNGPAELDGIEKVLKADSEKLEEILEREVYNYQDIGRVVNDFCSELGISNYSINIPMDLTEKEFYDTIISRLPGGSGFAGLKFVED